MELGYELWNTGKFGGFFLKKFLPERLKLPLTDPFHSVDEHNEELYQFLSNNLDKG